MSETNKTIKLDDLSIKILQYFEGDAKSASGLLQSYNKATVYRKIKHLLNMGLLEKVGKAYKTLPKGLEILNNKNKGETEETRSENKIETANKMPYLMDYEGQVKLLITTASKLQVSIETVMQLVELLKHISSYGFTVEKIKEIEAELRKAEFQCNPKNIILVIQLARNFSDLQKRIAKLEGITKNREERLNLLDNVINLEELIKQRKEQIEYLEEKISSLDLEAINKQTELEKATNEVNKAYCSLKQLNKLFDLLKQEKEKLESNIKLLKKERSEILGELKTSFYRYFVCPEESKEIANNILSRMERLLNEVSQ